MFIGSEWLFSDVYYDRKTAHIRLRPTKTRSVQILSTGANSNKAYSLALEEVWFIYGSTYVIRQLHGSHDFRTDWPEDACNLDLTLQYYSAARGIDSRNPCSCRGAWESMLLASLYWRHLLPPRQLWLMEACTCTTTTTDVQFMQAAPAKAGMTTRRCKLYDDGIFTPRPASQTVNV